MTSLLGETSFEVPSAPASYVDRVGPTALLNEGAQVPLTVVTAPAGSGKTSAVAAWAARSAGDRHVAWLHVDPEESLTRGRLWTFIDDSLLGRDHPEDASESTLIIDGFDDVDRSALADVDHLVRRGAGAPRLVLVSRAASGLPLHRYRLSSLVQEVGAADLAFSMSEAAALVGPCCPRLGPEGLEDLVRRTRGWAAGLRLAARSLAESPEPDEAALAVRGTDREIAAYLRMEVLTGRELRELAVRLSLLDVLRPGLVDEVGGSAAGRWLADCPTSGMLVDPVVAEQGCYRFQPLLRDLLRAELAGRSVRCTADLTRRAASWLADHGHGGEAAALVSAPPTLDGTHGLDNHSLRPGELIEPLTIKEMETLIHLSALLSTEEVAAEMFVSINTVRTHVRGILRKLAVSRRSEAVRRARALGLVRT